MKLTSNYIVYLNDLNKVQCAKCRVTGRFVKRVMAQTEYEKEYGFFAFSTLALLVILFTVHFSNVMSKLENMLIKIALSLDEVLSHLSNGKTVVLFTHLNNCLFNSKVSSEKELINELVYGEVKKGRVL
jgi:hypothetical protein